MDKIVINAWSSLEGKTGMYAMKEVKRQMDASANGSKIRWVTPEQLMEIVNYNVEPLSGNGTNGNKGKDKKIHGVFNAGNTSVIPGGSANPSTGVMALPFLK